MKFIYPAVIGQKEDGGYRAHFPDLAQCVVEADSLAIQRMIAMTARAAREAGIPVCVCGRAAADPKIAPLYVKRGVSSLSMASQSLLDIKEVLLNTDLSEVPSLA